MWDCPVCKAAKAFHTMPTDPRYKDRAKCWKCDNRGDLMDWVFYFNPGTRYPDRLSIVAGFEVDYARRPPDGDAPGAASGAAGTRAAGAAADAAGLPLRPGERGMKGPDPEPAADRRDRVLAAVNNLLDVAAGFHGPAPEWAGGELAAARFVVCAARIAREYGLSLDAMAAGCRYVIGRKLAAKPVPRVCPPAWVNPEAFARVENPKVFAWETDEGGKP